jgi:hypothetical protein
MICDTDDFLLVAQKWITDSATVILNFSLYESGGKQVFTMRLRGRITSIDREIPGLCFLPSDGDLVIIVLRDWQVGYADQSVFAPDDPNRMNEVFTLNRHCALLGVGTDIDDAPHTVR